MHEDIPQIVVLEVIWVDCVEYVDMKNFINNQLLLAIFLFLLGGGFWFVMYKVEELLLNPMMELMLSVMEVDLFDKIQLL